MASTTRTAVTPPSSSTVLGAQQRCCAGGAAYMQRGLNFFILDSRRVLGRPCTKRCVHVNPGPPVFTPASVPAPVPASVQVRTWTPSEGPFHGFLVTHNESISIADYFTVKDADKVVSVNH